MVWTTTNLIIQIITGSIGGHVAANATKEHSFGALGHTVAGLAGGAISGYFFQTLAGTVVDSTGVANQSDAVTDWMLQGLAGLVAGASVTLIVGLIKHSIDQHRAGSAKS
jgi:uncharacterized membrane protein YeaQ/YmgE (transglycosylase-associated protein family)